jgi:hypothetical protein
MSTWAYPTLVIVLVSAVYGVYLVNNILPQYHALNDASGDEDYFYRSFRCFCRKLRCVPPGNEFQAHTFHCEAFLQRCVLMVF